MKPALRGLAVAFAAVLLLAGCSDDAEESGGPIAQEAPPAVEPASPDSEGSNKATESDSERAQRVVDRGKWEGNAKVEAAARFYEELWASYSRGEVTSALDDLMTGDAAQVFPDQIAEKAKQGHVLNSLQASVFKVRKQRVDICMASASYQDIDADTGAPVEQADDGYTLYQVDMTKKSGRWRVKATRGFTESRCGERQE